MTRLTTYRASPTRLPRASYAIGPEIIANVTAGLALRGYHRTIYEATGRTDKAELDEIEDVMRHAIFHSTLDWQTRRQLADAAREAVEICAALGRIAP